MNGGTQMALPGFSGASSIYKTAVTYASVRVSGQSIRTSVRPAQGSSSCFAACFERCFSQCLSDPFWLWGQCISNCNANCTAHPCPPPRTCQNGSCVCSPPFTVCNGNCTSLLDDPNNCGQCGSKCPPWNFCASGQCFPIT